MLTLPGLAGPTAQPYTPLMGIPCPSPHHQPVNVFNSPVCSKTGVLQVDPSLVSSVTTACATVDDSSSPSSSYSALPVGFYSDAEIRDVWDREFLGQKHALMRALLTSKEYASESSVWHESPAGLRLLTDEMEEKIREVTTLPPVTSEYGTLWQCQTLFQTCLTPPMAYPSVGVSVYQIPVNIFGYSFYDGAKVRFRCSQCPKEWTSMKGRIVFHLFRMDSYAPCLTHPTTSEILLQRGYNLFFKVFKQQCHDANGHKQGDMTVFEEPQWYPEEIQKVLYNVFWRIGQTVYQVSIGDKAVQMWRRSGNPSHQHDKTSCQACQQGFCQSRSK